MAHPIRHRRAGDFGEVGLVCRIAILTCKEHILFPLLRGRLNQAAILALIVRNVTLANNKRCGLHHFTADLFKRSCAQMRHIDNIDRQQLCTQLLKAGQEHPSMLRNHSLIAILLYQLFATLHRAA